MMRNRKIIEAEAGPFDPHTMPYPIEIEELHLEVLLDIRDLLETITKIK